MRGRLTVFLLLLAATAVSRAKAQALPVTEQTVGSLTESGVYTYSPNDLGANCSLIGWSVVPAVTPVHGFGLQGDFESLYMLGSYPGQSRFLMAAGPRYEMAPRSRFTPFVFAEGGEMRLEQQRSRVTDWNPVAKGGFGFETRLTQHFGVTLVPGEYLGQYRDDGTWLHSFSARFGFTFLLSHDRMGPA